ncbi:hypothetical protein BJX62DRAFT_240679 [Aspergillus germanicus]
MSLDGLPYEIHGIILRHLTTNDLVSLSRTTRIFNSFVAPILYHHTFLDFALGDGDSSALDDNDIAFSALLGLVADTQGQCQYVQRLSVRSGEQEEEVSKAQDEEFVNEATTSAVSTLLQSALRNMSHVSHLDWLSTFSTPAVVFSALQCPLESLHCNAVWLDKSPNIGFNQTTTLDSLTSLSITEMVVGKVQPLLQTMLSKHETSLKSLRLQYLKSDGDSDSTSECPLNSLTETISSSGKRLNLTTLSLSLPRAPTTTIWFNSLISPSLTDFTYHIHAPNDQRADMVGGQIHNELFAYIHAEARSQSQTTQSQRRLKLNTLQTNTSSPALASLIESSRNLERLILTYQPSSFCGDALNLSGHFASLRCLCLSHADRILYDDEVFRLYGRDDFGYLQVIVDNCQLLEELAMNLCAGQEEYFFKTLRAAPALKRLFVLLYRNSPWDLQPPAGHLLREMLSYYRSNPSPFFERLELFSCFRSLWMFEHTMDLTADEVEEMEYELDYESVSDDELAELGMAGERRDLGVSSSLGSKRESMGQDKGKGDDEDEDDEDMDMGFDLFDAIEPMSMPQPPHRKNEYKYPQTNNPTPPVPILRDANGHIIIPRHLLDEPYCYTWERAISGYYKVALRVSWDEPRFLDDMMVGAVRGVVERYQWTDPDNIKRVEDEWRGATTQKRRWD